MFYWSFEKISCKSCWWLNTHVFFSTKTSADKWIYYDNSFWSIFPIKHNWQFSSCIINWLVGWINSYSILVWFCHTTFWFKKCVFAKWSFVSKGCCIFWIRQSFFCISTRNMSLLAKIVNAFVNLWGIFCHSLFDWTNRF